MFLKQFFVEGLGHASYLIASEQTKEAAVIDPGREIAVYLDEARAQGLHIRYVCETHVHNDFVSGAAQLAAAVGAEHVAPAEAGLLYPHRAIADGQTLRLGELVITAFATPGHTPEHTSYVVADAGRAPAPELVFSGGALLVGGVGRPDLLGPELGAALAPLLYESVHRKLLRLDDGVLVFPTHGSGSLCGKGIAGTRFSTIGYERRHNPALQQPTAADFVSYVLSGNPGIPAYYRRMRALNQQGPLPWRLPEPRLLPAEQVVELGRDGGALVVDARGHLAFGSGHVPGALNVWLGPAFPIWVGWLVPHDRPLAFVFERDADWSEAVRMLLRIGHEAFIGYLPSGMAAVEEAALPLARVPQLPVQEFEALRARERRLQIVDVRMDSEWQDGHIPGALHVMLGDLPARLGALDPARPVAVYCGSGNRSSIATSLLQRHGFPAVYNVLGGMTAWRAAGYQVVQPPPLERLAGASATLD